MIDPADPVALARTLIRCPSVTPEDAGAQDLLAEWLMALGFRVERLRFEAGGTMPVDNLFARKGTGGPFIAFAGHTDVVPPGPVEAWRHDPFAAVLEGSTLFGRGATDMKSGIAAFVAACARLGGHGGSIGLLITGDEEGPAVNGTLRLMQWAHEQGQLPDACIVGEPTCVERLGDTIKIGRRGSLSCRIEVEGIQGHVAYPHRADNAAHRITEFLHRVTDRPLDAGNTHFPPSSLQVTSINIANPAGNVIPGKAAGHLNIRYNTEQSFEGLKAWLKGHADATGGSIALAFEDNARPFVTEPGPLSDVLVRAIHAETGVSPDLTTTGGTSDARFISQYCSTIEFGLTGKTMHAVDECANIDELEQLTRIYGRFLSAWLGAA